mmetsp:Transcript_5557/g.16580  ORF Transcript_5557/g.16580 Transcript_5557/m.16580 type:complete len:210 (-) Transcript_5557:732-1361(-)
MGPASACQRGVEEPAALVHLQLTVYHAVSDDSRGNNFNAHRLPGLCEVQQHRQHGRSGDRVRLEAGTWRRVPRPRPQRAPRHPRRQRGTDSIDRVCHAQLCSARVLVARIQGWAAHRAHIHVDSDFGTLRVLREQALQRNGRHQTPPRYPGLLLPLLRRAFHGLLSVEHHADICSELGRCQFLHPSETHLLLARTVCAPECSRLLPRVP